MLNNLLKIIQLLRTLQPAAYDLNHQDIHENRFFMGGPCHSTNCKFSSNHMQQSWTNWERLDESYSCQSVAPGSASAWPENLLEIQMITSHPRPTESGTVGMGPRNLHFNKPSRDSYILLRLRTTSLERRKLREDILASLMFWRAVTQRER